MNVSLTRQMLAFVNGLVEAGGYASASEVVLGGLRLLKSEKAIEAERFAVLKHEVEAGLVDAHADRFSSRTATDIGRSSGHPGVRHRLTHRADDDIRHLLQGTLREFGPAKCGSTQT